MNDKPLATPSRVTITTLIAAYSNGKSSAVGALEGISKCSDVTYDADKTCPVSAIYTNKCSAVQSCATNHISQCSAISASINGPLAKNKW